jgi:hypothetical protein
MCGHHHAQAALPLGKSPRYPLDRRLGGPQGRPEHWSRENSCSCCESNTGHPASSLSLYQLRYSGSLIITIILITGSNDDSDDDTVWFEYIAMEVLK